MGTQVQACVPFRSGVSLGWQPAQGRAHAIIGVLALMTFLTLPEAARAV